MAVGVRGSTAVDNGGQGWRRASICHETEQCGSISDRSPIKTIRHKTRSCTQNLPVPLPNFIHLTKQASLMQQLNAGHCISEMYRDGVGFLLLSPSLARVESLKSTNEEIGKGRTGHGDASHRFLNEILHLSPG